MNEISKEERDENFSYTITDLADDRYLGDYEPDKNAVVGSVVGSQEAVGGYSPTHPEGYYFPSLKSSQEQEPVRPKEDALLVAKMVLSKFLKEKVESYRDTQDAKELLFKRRDLDEYAKRFHNPRTSSFPVSALEPRGEIYAKFGFLIQNRVKRNMLTQIRDGNKHTYLISKMEECVLDD